ncbi:hypothetical protein N7517_008946 [Penicillium concentricum]|uniref:Uncharacterized protein n=1 Tax=Penicillium concentricum TaxID=293559 RepID=A0A9W9UYD5_9EURO|nr:uncharacterized protein N7517_008946 [Penicillium concentricum]KAJ5359755.1 hypothetical protein N7517_008946 [Penicillium concentricum]
MVAASRRTSELGEITHRSGASGHPATLDPPPILSSPRSVASATPGLGCYWGALAALGHWCIRCGD